MTFAIDIKVLSWNSIACKHWRVYKAAADEAKQVTMIAIRNAKLKPIKEFPVSIHFHAKWKNSNKRDVDALYCKAVLDQLVNDKILPDDSLPFISKVIYTGEIKAEKDELIVTIEKSF